MSISERDRQPADIDREQEEARRLTAIAEASRQKDRGELATPRGWLAARTWPYRWVLRAWLKRKLRGRRWDP